MFDGLGTINPFLPATVVPRKMHPRIADIKQVVCADNAISMAEIEGPSRQRRVARPRMVAYALCRELTRASLPVIGQQFGGRDHTTVLHGARVIANLLKTDEWLAKSMANYRVELARIVEERGPPIEPPPAPDTDPHKLVRNFDEPEWTQTHLAILKSCWRLGIPSKMIGNEIGRSSAAIRSKAHKLGLGGRQWEEPAHFPDERVLGLSA